MTTMLTPTFDEMVVAMLTCEQSPGFSVYQHGVSVSKFFFDLISDVPSNQWKLPDWFTLHKKELVKNSHPEEIYSKYLLFHDCGKPYCHTIEGDKVHFPNHAEVSGDIWEAVGGNPIVGKLIRNDMVLHTANAEEINDKLQNEWSIQDACTLLLAAFSEIHSNASMFGGQDSVSFKMKWKQLDRRGKQLCKHYFGGK